MSRLGRLARVVVATSLLVGALATHQLTLPGTAFACSCVEREPGAPVFPAPDDPGIRDGQVAVFVGTAGQPQPDGTYRFAVERWFVGGDAAEINVMSNRIPGPDGAVSIDTCGLHFEVGDRLIMQASVQGGIYHPGACSPHAVIASDDGQQLLTAAVERFGQGTTPGPPVDTPAPEEPDLAGLALGAVGVLIVVVLVVVVASARRRRDEEPVA